MAIRDTAAQDVRRPEVAPSTRLLRNGGPLLLLVLACIGALAFVAWRWGSGARSVDATRLRIATVTRGDLVRDIAADGRLISANSPSLYAIAGGTVTPRVVAGDPVHAGQILAEIDSPELRSRLAQEAATLASLEADVSRARMDARLAHSAAVKRIDQALVEQTAAQRELERNTRGFEGGAVAKVEVAKSQDAMQNAQIGLAHAREDAGLQGASSGLDARNKQALAARQRAVVSELKRQVDALAIRAPFDGQVGQVFVQPHQNIQANAPILSVVDLARFEVEIKVPESFARDLTIGMPAQLSGNNQTYAASVSAVSPEVVNGEVAARLRFADGAQPPGLRQSQRLSARILLDTRRNVLKVERGPSLDAQSQAAWRIREGVATRVPVQPGAVSLDAVEVRSGLVEGDRVIVSGAEEFKPTETVRVH